MEKQKEGRERTKQREESPGRVLLAQGTAQQDRVHPWPWQALAAHLERSQNALQGQCSPLTLAVRLFRCKQLCTTQQPSVHTCTVQY